MLKSLEIKYRESLNKIEELKEKNESLENQISTLKKILEVVEEVEIKFDQIEEEKKEKQIGSVEEDFLSSSLLVSVEMERETNKKEEQRERVFDLIIGSSENSQALSETVSKLANELQEYNKILEEEKEKKSKLESEIKEKKFSLLFFKKQKKKNLEEEIVRLNELLEEVNRKIKEWEDKIREVEKKLVEHYQFLQGQIKEKTEKLEAKKRKCIEKINSERSEELVKGLLKTQEVITKLKDDDYFVHEKSELIHKAVESISEEQKEQKVLFINELRELCSLKEKIIQLESELKDTRKIAVVFNIQSIVGVEGNVEIKGNYSPQIAQQEQGLKGGSKM